jgi:CheY-like chemotaxis protein
VKKENILWIEDEPEFMRACTLWLEKQGYKLKISKTVQEAEGDLKKEKYDLVLIDIMLPDDDKQAEVGNLNFNGGIELAKMWEKSGTKWETPWGTPFGFVTAVLEEEGDTTREEALNLVNGNENLYLEKPIGLEDFTKMFAVLVLLVERYRKGRS